MNKPLVVISDLHVNSTVGLLAPDLRGTDGTEYPQNKFQIWLWKNWLEFWKQVPKGSPVVINGDVVQGIHSDRDGQIVTTSKVTQHKAALGVLKPVIEKASKIYIIRGTGFHAGTSGNDEEAIALSVKAVPNPDTGEYSRWFLYLEYNKTVTYFAHHTSYTSVYPMTGLTRESARARETNIDGRIPDMLVFSHIHKHHLYVDKKPHVVTTPSWQLKTEYIYKRNPQALPEIGGLLLWQDKGQTRVESKLFNLPKPVVETLR